MEHQNKHIIPSQAINKPNLSNSTNLMIQRKLAGAKNVTLKKANSQLFHGTESNDSKISIMGEEGAVNGISDNGIYSQLGKGFYTTKDIETAANYATSNESNSGYVIGFELTKTATGQAIPSNLLTEPYGRILKLPNELADEADTGNDFLCDENNTQYKFTIAQGINKLSAAVSTNAQRDEEDRVSTGNWNEK